MKRIYFLGLLVVLFFASCNNEPLEDGFFENNNQGNCTEAALAVANAAQAFTEATEATYSELCTAYKNALQAQIAICGDATGTLQQLINSLGDCNNGGDQGTSTGDYWPRALQNEWNYTGNLTYKMISTEVINGLNYYKFEDLSVGKAWLRKSGDQYILRNQAVGAPVQGYTVETTPLEVIMLKDSEEAGGTWVSNVSYTTSYTPNDSSFPPIDDVTTSFAYNFEMIARDISRTVNGEEYNNVLHVRLSLNFQGAVSTVNYYYAKDIGLIESSGSTGNNLLTSYSLN